MSQSVVGVRFKPVGKIYQFDPGEIKLELGDHVIVETAKGREYGEVAYARKEIDENDLHTALKPILRRATPDDQREYQEIKKVEARAKEVFIEKSRERDLQMKLIDVEFTFDKKKIVFYFAAEGRVDFRDLVKDLASEFRVRIELRQIGVRDEAKTFNGVGICGRPCCCSQWIGEFFPVTIKMAKEQNLSLNSSKISGICGRLLCCLTYEQAYYEEISKKMPRVGFAFKTPDGPAEVFKLKTLEERVLAKIKNEKDEVEIRSYTLDELDYFKEHADEYPDEPVKKVQREAQKSAEKEDESKKPPRRERVKARKTKGSGEKGQTSPRKEQTERKEKRPPRKSTKEAAKEGTRDEARKKPRRGGRRRKPQRNPQEDEKNPSGQARTES